MKRKKGFWIATSILCLFCACTKQDLDLNASETEATTRALEEEDVFYYYGYENKKIFLREIKDRIFVKFAPDATREQFQAVANNKIAPLSKKLNGEVRFVKGSSLNTMILESKEMSPAVLDSLKTKNGIASATYLLEQNGSFSAITDEFIVKLKETTSYEQLQELAEKYNCRLGDENEFVKNQFKLYVSKTAELNAMQMANRFYETGLFEFSEPNFAIINAANSDDPHFPFQWNLKNTGQFGQAGIDIKAEQAWAITKGSPNIKIAVIDDGVDLTHPDLQGNLLPGYDATGRNTAGGPYDDNDLHGTWVAGVIGALQNNRVNGSYEGISGIAPNCKIIPIKAAYNGICPTDLGANAINWAVQNGADVINCSWSGGGAYTPLTNAINNAVINGRGRKGCVVVYSSGNNGVPTVNYPAILSNVIAVGAVDVDGYRRSDSNYGTALDVVAPGEMIHTTDRQDRQGTTIGLPGKYDPTFSRTSAAAPHVSGIAALILSIDPLYLSRQQVTDIILQSADRYPNRHNEYGYGLVDAYKAVLKIWKSNVHIAGPSDAAWLSNTTYSIINHPAAMAFSGWIVTPNDCTITGSTTSSTLNIRFGGATEYTLRANFTLPDGSLHSISKTVRNQRFSTPIISYNYENGEPAGPALWTAKAFVFNVQTHVDYEWNINGSLVYSSPTFPTSIYLPAFSNNDRFVVLCRARMGSAASDWSNALSIAAP